MGVTSPQILRSHLVKVRKMIIEPAINETTLLLEFVFLSRRFKAILVAVWLSLEMIAVV